MAICLKFTVSYKRPKCFSLKAKPYIQKKPHSESFPISDIDLLQELHKVSSCIFEKLNSGSPALFIFGEEVLFCWYMYTKRMLILLWYNNIVIIPKLFFYLYCSKPSVCVHFAHNDFVACCIRTLLSKALCWSEKTHKWYISLFFTPIQNLLYVLVWEKTSIVIQNTASSIPKVTSLISSCSIVGIKVWHKTSPLHVLTLR